MANRYWVGGTGTWDTTAGTKWSTTSGGTGGASVPVTGDVAIFDANSNPGGGGASYTVTKATAPACYSMSLAKPSGAGAVLTLAGTGTFSLIGTTTILTIANDGGVNWTATGLISGNSSAGISINTNGVSIASPVQNQLDITLLSNFVTTSSFTLIGATLALGSFSMSCRNFNASSATVTVTGSGNINLTGSGIVVFSSSTTFTTTSLPSHNCAAWT